MIVPADVLAWIASSAGAQVPDLSTEDDAALARVVGAVTAHVAHTHEAPDPITDDYTQALVMQAARLWQRRFTPSGVEGVGDFGPVRVTRLDHDVEALLAPYRTFPFS